MKKYDRKTFSLPNGEEMMDELDALAKEADRLSEEAERLSGDRKEAFFYETLAELGHTVCRMNEIERTALFSDEGEAADPEEIRRLSERFAVLTGCFLQGGFLREEAEA